MWENRYLNPMGLHDLLIRILLYQTLLTFLLLIRLRARRKCDPQFINHRLKGTERCNGSSWYPHQFSNTTSCQPSSFPKKIKVGLCNYQAVCISLFRPLLSSDSLNHCLRNLVRILSWQPCPSQRRISQILPTVYMTI
jgi:hypothetical protein